MCETMNFLLCLFVKSCFIVAYDCYRNANSSHMSQVIDNLNSLFASIVYLCSCNLEGPRPHHIACSSMGNRHSQDFTRGALTTYSSKSSAPKFFVLLGH